MVSKTAFFSEKVNFSTCNLWLFYSNLDRLLYDSYCIHLYCTEDGSQWSSFQWIRVLFKAVTDISVPPRASAFKQGRHYGLCNSHTQTQSAAGVSAALWRCSQGRVPEGHKSTWHNTAVVSSQTPWHFLPRPHFLWQETGRWMGQKWQKPLLSSR